jgi:hypothetical protein
MFDLIPTRPIFALLIGPKVRVARGILVEVTRPVDLTVLTRGAELPDAPADEHIHSQGPIPFVAGSFDVLIGTPAALSGQEHLLSPGGRIETI